MVDILTITYNGKSRAGDINTNGFSQMKKDQNKGVPITFSSGPLVQTIQTKKMKLKHLARKGEVEKLTISEAKRRTAERQEEGN